MTLDLDSSVVTRYGEQEGAKVGYNPHKPGRPSHHPIIAFMPEMRMVVNAWMRPGNTADLSNYRSFLDETFSILSNKKVGLVRADSGFFSNGFMEYCEARQLNYITAVKFYKPIKHEVFHQKAWIALHDGIENGMVLSSSRMVPFPAHDCSPQESIQTSQIKREALALG